MRKASLQALTPPVCNKPMVTCPWIPSAEPTHQAANPLTAASLSRKERNNSMIRYISLNYPTKVRCPVDGCSGRATTRSSLRYHFLYRHPNDTLHILEKGPDPYRTHLATAVCRAGAARCRQERNKEEARAIRDVVFFTQGQQLETVPQFKYLGRLLTSQDNE